MVYRADLAFEHGEDLIAYFRSRSTEAGGRVRTTPTQVVATRDFDTYHIEVYYASEDQPDYGRFSLGCCGRLDAGGGRELLPGLDLSPMGARADADVVRRPTPLGVVVTMW